MSLEQVEFPNRKLIVFPDLTAVYLDGQSVVSGRGITVERITVTPNRDVVNITPVRVSGVAAQQARITIPVSAIPDLMNALADLILHT